MRERHDVFRCEPRGGRTSGEGDGQMYTGRVAMGNCGHAPTVVVVVIEVTEAYYLYSFVTDKRTCQQ